MDFFSYKAIVLSILALSSVACYYLELQRAKQGIIDDSRMSFGFSFLFVVCLIIM
mgnify:CR=1 FL=1